MIQPLNRFPKNWSANERRPSFLARPITGVETFVIDTLDNEIGGRTEMYSKFRYQKRWSAEKVV
jgi:hypothetical protein